MGHADQFLTVAETARRLGVHQNTVRNWVRNGTLRSVSVPGARTNRFDARDVERLVSQRGELVSTVAEERRTIGPELVDASQLEQWAKAASRDAQQTLPELVRRLLSHTPGVTAISLRAGDGVALSGWDGEAHSNGASFLPAGELRFEIGAGEQSKRKADTDWSHRRDTPNARALTFVFVTPRRWRDGKAWASARKAEGIFADVRVLDADDLEGWLHTIPHVHYWISEHLGRTPQHAQTLQQWWLRFSRQTKPNLPASLFLAGREGASERLHELLSGEPSIITVSAKWRDDSLAFVAASLEAITTEPERVPPPAMVVTGPDAWHRLAAVSPPTVLIPLFDNADLVTAVDSGHHVLVPADGDNPVGGSQVIHLQPTGREHARKSLEETEEFSLDQAYKLAALARRSMPSFVRALSRDQRRRRPDWAADPDSAAILSPLMLAGQWTSTEGDWAVVSDLAGVDKLTIERLLLHLRRTDDPPFVQPGDSQWHVASQDEGLTLLRDQLTTTDLDRWRRLVPRVLLELNPMLNLGVEDQMLAGVRGIKRNASGALRRGLAEGLAALASLGGEPLAGNTTCGEVAGQVVSALLANAATDASGRTWQSLSDVLPLLAEAAPATFLDAVLDDLDSPLPRLATMFRDDEAMSWLGASSPHSGLLWALETLCWSQDYIGSATFALAKLQLVDPGGRLANRPLASLQSVLVFWIRHTSAPLQTRIDAIEGICRQIPEVGWQLVLALWPSTHSTAMPPARPRYRDWQPDNPRVPVAEAVEFIDRLVTLAVSLANEEPSRWKELVTGIAPLPPNNRSRLLEALEQQASSGLIPNEARLELWEKLRTEVDRHRQFSDASWTMDEAARERLEHIAGLVEPTAGAERFSYLFDWHVDLPDIDRLDFAARDERLWQLRNDAVRETLASGSIADLQALARRVKVPSHLGWAIGETAPDAMEPELASWLVSDDPSLRETALAWLRCKLADPDGGLGWFRHMLASEAMDGEAQRLDLLMSTPFRNDFWDAVAEIDPKLADEYWLNCRPPTVSPADIARAIEELLARDRPWLAIDLIAGVLHRTDREFSTLTVDDANRTIERAITTPPPANAMQAVGYEVGVVLDYLENGGTDQAALARYEFALFPLIEHHRRPRALFKALGSDYQGYVELVSRVFRGKNQNPRQLGEAEAAVARHSYWVLSHWHGMPGLDDQGAIDGAHLKNWVTEARLLFAEGDRADIGDEQIGQVLSNSPPGSDGIWPAEPVREIVETVGSASLESGLVIGALNSRGVTSRGVFDGGAQERALALKYRDWSRALATVARRTSRALRLIAESYEREARQHDSEAGISSDSE